MYRKLLLGAGVVAVGLILFAWFDRGGARHSPPGQEFELAPQADHGAVSAPITSQPPAISRPSFVPSQVMVRFNPGVPESRIAAVLDGIGAAEKRRFGTSQVTILVSLPPTVSVPVGQAYFDRQNVTDISEPNFYYYLSAVPDDEFFAAQWSLQNTGQQGGTPGADIGATIAWDTTTGSDSVYIGIIDSGLDVQHPDIADNIWTNQGDPLDGVDNDGNGWIDDTHGGNGWDPNDGRMIDFSGHGTNVAGVLAASGNNGAGISGVMWQAQLIPCIAFDANGYGTLESVLGCMDYFTTLKESGVDVVATNNSWGGFNYSELLLDAITEHHTLDILFVNAVGNDALDLDVEPNWPASYDVPNVIGVAATDRNGMLADFSNFGTSAADIAAPGVEVLTTEFGADYETYNGTSFSAPLVTGVIGLLKSKDPGLTGQEIRDHLLASGTASPELVGRVASGSILRAVIPIRDYDGDLIDDDWELSRGLDPGDSSDAAVDDDGDGLTNFEEYQADSDPLLPDTDGDGLSDYEEIATYQTSPLVVDTDGDGLSDFDEVNLYPTSPLLADSDGDGVNDYDEINVSGTEPDNPDSDGDGMLDGYERTHGLLPLDNSDRDLDPDSDGLSNLEEHAARTDAQSPDSDNDGLTDSEELNVTATDPTRSDTDGDRMPDGWESGFGLDPNDSSDAALDPDRDALSNHSEYRVGTDPTDGESTPESAAWRSTRGNLNNKGFGKFESDETQFRTRWVAEDLEDYVYTQSTEYGQSIFTFMIERATTGVVVGRELLNANEIWRTEIPGVNLFGEVVAVDGVLAVLAQYEDGSRRLLGLNPVDGEVLYATVIDEFVARYYLKSSGNTLVVASRTSLLSFDAATGLLNWSIPVTWPEDYRITASERYIVTFGDQTLTVLDPVDGSELRRGPAGNCSHLFATLKLGESNSLYLFGIGCVERFNIDDLSLDWWNVGSSGLNDVTPDDSAVFMAMTGGVRALDKETGTVQWEWASYPERLQRNIVVTLDHVFVSTDHGTRAFDRNTGDLVWKNPHFGDLTLTSRGALVIAEDGGMQLVDLQGDLDSDGLPNWWEKLNGLDYRAPGDELLDADTDGLVNAGEFIARSDISLPDTDGDGLTDGEEVNTWSSDPLLVDTDLDRVNDFDEVSTHGTRPDAYDSDGDRYDDYAELMSYGTDPTSRTDAPVLRFSQSESFERGLPPGWTIPAGAVSGWVVDPGSGSLGESALKAQSVSAGQSAAIEFSNVFSTGRFTLDARIGVPSSGDSLVVLVDDVVQRTVTNGDWQDVTFTVTQGHRTVRIEYRRVGSDHSSTETAWIDNMVFEGSARHGTSVKNAFLQYGNSLYESDPEQVRTLSHFAIPDAVDARGVTVMDDHRLVIADSPSIHVFDLYTRTWRLLRIENTWGEAFFSGNGNVIQVGEKILLTDTTQAKGIIVTDRNGRMIDRKTIGAHYKDLTLGDDGFVYGLRSGLNILDRIDPDSLEILDSTRLLRTLDADAVAVNASSEIFAAYFASATDWIFKFTPEGEFIDELRIGGIGGRTRDLEFREDGVLVVSTLAGILGYISTDFRSFTTHDVVGLSDPTGPLPAGFTAVVRKRGMDSDGDLAEDWWENVHGFDAEVADVHTDFDGDGISDLGEFNANTHPLNPDTDGDGLSDGDEANTYLTDPLQSDSDHDGVEDGEEVRVHLTDPLDTDSDNDGIDDGEELLVLGSDPLTSDGDNDGIEDRFERDNGLDPANAADAAGDRDGDGLTNLEEFVAGTDPNNTDSDFDGLEDGDESNVYRTDPANYDSDSDHLADGWEIRYGLSPLTFDDADQDSDGDLFPDRLEYFSDTDPTDPVSWPRSAGWVSDQGDTKHSGYVPVRLHPAEFSYLWSRTVTENAWESLEHIATRDDSAWVFVPNLPGVASVQSINVFSGATNWEAPIGATTTASSPALAVDRVYVHASLYSRLVALDAQTGELDFEASLDGYPHRTKAPAIDDGEVYLCDGPYGGIGSFSAIDGSRLWQGFAKQEYGWSPAIDDRYVYAYVAALGSTSRELIALYRSNGTRAGMVNDDFYPEYFWIPNSVMVGSNNAVHSVRYRRAESFDINTFTKKWQTIVDSTEPAALANGVLYVVSGGELVGLDERHGTEVFRWKGPGLIIDAPLLTIDHAIVTTRTSIHAVDLRTGIEVWNYPVSGKLSLGNGGVLMVAGRQGEVHAIQTFSDLDSDSMPDRWESANGLNSGDASDASQDDDHDGLTNLQEFWLLSDPTNDDTDSDGLLDGEERNVHYTDVFDSDSDNDGLGDSEEVSTYGTSPTTIDSDGDNVPDGDEVHVYATDPAVADTDGDSILDGWEIKLGSDPLDEFSMPPLATGYVESFESGQLPRGWTNNTGTQAGWATVESDSTVERFSIRSGDLGVQGVASLEWSAYFESSEISFDARVGDPFMSSDLSLYVDDARVPNLYFRDTWEETSISVGPGVHTLRWELLRRSEYELPDPYAYLDNLRVALLDSDGDGLPDDWENANGFNPLIPGDDARDPDDDGLTNLREFQNGTDPNNSDSDADGMPDGWEVENRLNPLVDDSAGDADSDGASNLQEYIAGTDPNVAPPPPPPPNPPASSGGGGMLDLKTLITLFLFVAAQARLRRRRTGMSGDHIAA